MKFNGRYRLDHEDQKEQIYKPSFDEEIVYSDFKKRRTLSIYGEINKQKEFVFNHMLSQLTKPDKDGKKLPITIKISSEGGEVNSGLSITSSIISAKKSGYEIIAEAYGEVMSMAVLPVIVSSKRKSQPYTRFLIHNPLAFMMGYVSAEQFNRTTKEMNGILDLYKNVILENTLIEKDMLEKSFDRDAELIFLGEEAKNLGFIDEIF